MWKQQGCGCHSNTFVIVKFVYYGPMIFTPQIEEFSTHNLDVSFSFMFHSFGFQLIIFLFICAHKYYKTVFNSVLESHYAGKHHTTVHHNKVSSYLYKPIKKI